MLHCKYGVMPSTKATNLQNNHYGYKYDTRFGLHREKNNKATKHKIIEMPVNQCRTCRANQDAQ